MELLYLGARDFRRGETRAAVSGVATSFDRVRGTGTGVQPGSAGEGFDARPETLGRPGGNRVPAAAVHEVSIA
jgi:hypothetical protein